MKVHSMPKSELSQREQETIEFAAQGLTDQMIALKLGISLATVSTYWVRIRTKLGSLTRAELVAHYVAEQGERDLETLRSQNEHLQSQLQAHAASHDFITAMVQQAPEAVLFVDESGVITYGNDLAAALFGCEPGSMAGLRIGKFIPAEFHDAHRGHRERFFEDGQRRVMGEHRGLDAVRLDGKPIRITGTVSRAMSPGGPVAVLFARLCP